jgi:nitrate/nitrite transport system substrate-binding protein
MSTFDNPFDPSRSLNGSGCACGRHVSQAEHERDAARQLQCVAVESEDKRYQQVVASAVMRTMFPADKGRRAFLQSLGASTALAALSQFFPLKTATEIFAAGGPIEKKDLKVGFIPITCATPIIMAKPMGFYEKQGLNVEVIKTAGWAVIRDKTINKEYDAAHMLSPMPLAITMGVGSKPIPYTMPAVENINGQAITLAIKHKDKRDPKDWKGMKFAVPFDYSMHNYLLRYYVAEHGIDPDQDIQIRAVPPPEMVANLRADNIDGFLASDPVTASYTCCQKKSGTGIRAAPSRHRRSSSPRVRTHMSHCSRRSSMRPPSPTSRKIASKSRKQSLRPTISTSRLPWSNRF